MAFESNYSPGWNRNNPSLRGVQFPASFGANNTVPAALDTGMHNASGVQRGVSDALDSMLSSGTLGRDMDRLGALQRSQRYGDMTQGAGGVRDLLASAFPSPDQALKGVDDDMRREAALRTGLLGLHRGRTGVQRSLVGERIANIDRQAQLRDLIAGNQAQNWGNLQRHRAGLRQGAEASVAPRKSRGVFGDLWRGLKNIF